MRIAERVRTLPPYLFAAIERQIADRRAAGIDVISLGIGDPDLPTPPHVVAALAEAAADPSTHQYPSNRGELGFREAVAGFYATRFGVALDPADQIVPLLGAKEGIAHLCQVLLDPGDLALAADPGYPVYVDGPGARRRSRRARPARGRSSASSPTSRPSRRRRSRRPR